MAKAPGATLQTADGAYRIHEVVAVGGFASVYFGRNLTTNVPVAVKLLHPHHVTDERVLRHFVNEAVLARGLSHPNVVGIVDQGQAEDGQPFIVMEWMTGWTVATLIEDRGALAPGEAAFIAEQTLRALSAAHARSIYHRDIKPANLMLTADGAVKVMDFGISKDASLAAASGVSGVMGTPAYMAPEQYRGEMTDGRTDIYALGVTLYQMLVGKVPFESTSTHGYMYQHLEKPPPPLRVLRPDLPPPLESIVMIALEKAPERRFQSAPAMAAALGPFSSHGVALPSRLPDGTIVAPPSTPPGTGPGWTPPPAPPASPPSQTPPPAAPEPAWTPTPGPSPETARPVGVQPAHGPAGWSSAPTAPPARRPGHPLVWGLLGLAAALVVFGGLVGGYLLLESRRPADQQAGTTIAPAGAAPSGPTPGGAGPQPAGVTPAAAASSPVASGGNAAQCSSGLSIASNQRQQRALAEAATTLESLRASGCEVAEPLYDVYLDLGRELADAERIDEAITRFDQALQVKNGDEARSARVLAAAYREGRGAIERRSWDDAIQKLDTVHRSSPTYAKGNVVTHLAAAFVGKGDDLRQQGKQDDALEAYRRAAQLKPNDGEIAARVRDTEADQTARRLAEAAAREPTRAPTPPPPAPAESPALLERVATEYYAAIDERRYDAAYALLSTQARGQQTLDQFRARFVNTRRIGVRSFEGARIEGTAGFLTVHTRTVNATPQGEAVACSRVEWVLVREQQGWRRDVVSGSGNEQGERC